MRNFKIIRQLPVLIIAGGISRRMGNKNKLFLKIGNNYLVNIVVKKFHILGFRKIYIVLGYQSQKVKKILNKKYVKILINKSFNLGQSSSIKYGLSKIDRTESNILIALSDMPFFSADLILNLVDRHFSISKYKNVITLPKFKDSYRNPVIWNNVFFSELKNLEGDRGGKSIIYKNLNAINVVEWSSENELMDIDKKKDLFLLKKRFNSNLNSKYLFLLKSV